MLGGNFEPRSTTSRMGGFNNTAIAMKDRVDHLPVMNNKRLNKFSSKYRNDSDETVEKRCFFLFAGTDLNVGPAFNLDLTFAKHDDPNV